MSKKVTKVDGSIDEKNGLKYTVGDKSLGLLSTTIDKALMLKDEETQLNCSPEYAERANIDLTLVQVTRKRFDCHGESRVRECRCGECLSLTGINKETVVEKVQEEKMTIAKSTVANAAAEEGTLKQVTHGHITTWCRCECTARGSGSSPRANVGDSEFLHHGVSAREKQEVLEQLS